MHPSQNDTMVKAGLMGLENVLEEIHPSELYSDVAFVFRRATVLCE